MFSLSRVAKSFVFMFSVAPLVVGFYYHFVATFEEINDSFS